MVRRHGHREVHPPDTLQRGRDALGSGQIAEDDLRAERTQPSRTIVVAADHRAHRHVLRAQLFEDLAAHAPGAGDENEVAGNHRWISL
jgi:hypothetical protein